MLFNTSTNTTCLHQAIKCILFFVSISSGTFELNRPRRHSEQISIGIWQFHWINNKAKMEMQLDKLETEQILDIFFRRIKYQYIMRSIKISIGWRLWLSQATLAPFDACLVIVIMMTSSKKNFPRGWPFVWRIHRSPVISLTRPVTRSLDGFFDPCLNKRLSKQLRCRWFETPSRSLLRQSNVVMLRWFLDFYLMSNTRLQTYWYTNISDLYRCSSAVALCHGFESRVPISLYISRLDIMDE